MITKIITLSSFIFILCCNNIELVLEDNNSAQQLKNNIFVVMSGEKNERYNREIYSFFGSNKNSDYILTTLFNERKENRVVKKNQVAEKINYELLAKRSKLIFFTAWEIANQEERIKVNP